MSWYISNPPINFLLHQLQRIMQQQQHQIEQTSLRKCKRIKKVLCLMGHNMFDAWFVGETNKHLLVHSLGPHKHHHLYTDEDQDEVDQERTLWQNEREECIHKLAIPEKWYQAEHVYRKEDRLDFILTNCQVVYVLKDSSALQQEEGKHPMVPRNQMIKCCLHTIKIRKQAKHRGKHLLSQHQHAAEFASPQSNEVQAGEKPTQQQQVVENPGLKEEEEEELDPLMGQ